jgi:hypothetical protein
MITINPFNAEVPVDVQIFLFWDFLAGFIQHYLDRLENYKFINYLVASICRVWIEHLIRPGPNIIKLLRS